MPSTAAWSAASLSPAPDERRAGERGGLGDAHELQREVAVRTLVRGVGVKRGRRGAEGKQKRTPSARAGAVSQRGSSRAD